MSSSLALNMSNELQPGSPIEPIENIVPTTLDENTSSVASNTQNNLDNSRESREISSVAKPTTTITVNELDAVSPVDVFEPVVDGSTENAKNISTRNKEYTQKGGSSYYRKYMKYKYKYMKANKN